MDSEKRVDAPKNKRTGDAFEFVRSVYPPVDMSGLGCWLRDAGFEAARSISESKIGPERRFASVESGGISEEIAVTGEPPLTAD